MLDVDDRRLSTNLGSLISLAGVVLVDAARLVGISEPMSGMRLRKPLLIWVEDIVGMFLLVIG